jgi:hypothetical protein
MNDNERVFLSYEDAVELLPEGDHIHTFRSNIPGVLVGADWPRDELLEAMKNHRIELSGEMATGMQHGIVIIDKQGPLFIETRTTDVRY